MMQTILQNKAAYFEYRTYFSSGSCLSRLKKSSTVAALNDRKNIFYKSVTNLAITIFLILIENFEQSLKYVLMSSEKNMLRLELNQIFFSYATDRKKYKATSITKNYHD